MPVRINNVAEFAAPSDSNFIHWPLVPSDAGVQSSSPFKMAADETSTHMGRIQMPDGRWYTWSAEVLGDCDEYALGGHTIAMLWETVKAATFDGDVPCIKEQRKAERMGLGMVQR